MIALLQNDARGFVFDTALPPSVVAAAHAALEVVASADGDARRARVTAHADRVRARLREHGVAVSAEGGAIVPIVLGETQAALVFARVLAERGIVAPAIRPPTVPRGEAQIRLTLRADHEDVDVDMLLAALDAARLVSA